MHTESNSRLWLGWVMALMLLPCLAQAQTCRTTIAPSIPSKDFTLHGDGTVTHNPTGLMWMVCSLGATWDGSNCSGAAEKYTWSDALKQAVSSQFGGYTDWRVPNKNELSSIVERSCYGPAINSRIFPATPDSHFWSSSPYAGYSNGAWLVSFDYGNLGGNGRNNSAAVRLVRGGQSLDSAPALVPPTVSFTATPASVKYNGNSTLKWSSTNATSCAAKEWLGNDVSGSVLMSNLTDTQTYTLTCTGSGGTTSKSVTVTVAPKPTPSTSTQPTVALTATPTTVKSGGSTTLDWSSTDATQCTPSGAWSGTIGTSGTLLMTELISDKTYTLTCTGSGGSATKSVTVTVNNGPTQPPTTPTTDPISCVFNYFESKYPQYYAPANKDLLTYRNNTYRYYGTTDSLLVYSPTDDRLYGGYGYYGYGYYYGYYYLDAGSFSYWKSAAGCK